MPSANTALYGMDPTSYPGGHPVPTYAYTCTQCGHAFDVHQSFTDAALTVCPQCQGRLRKVFSPVGVVFKGSGFYRTDARSSSSSSSSPAKEAVGASSGSSGKGGAAGASAGSSGSSAGSSSSGSSSAGSSSGSSTAGSSAKAATA